MVRVCNVNVGDFRHGFNPSAETKTVLLCEVHLGFFAGRRQRMWASSHNRQRTGLSEALRCTWSRCRQMDQVRHRPQNCIVESACEGVQQEMEPGDRHAWQIQRRRSRCFWCTPKILRDRLCSVSPFHVVQSFLSRKPECTRARRAALDSSPTSNFPMQSMGQRCFPCSR